MRYLVLLLTICSLVSLPVYIHADQFARERTRLEQIAGGMVVPIGGMVAVMPSIDAAAWQPPASGAIKDGFMRADGHQITAANVTAGSLIPAGVYLPNMVSMVARGGTTSCDGSVACNSKTGGNDTSTLVSGNIPNHTHSAGTYDIAESNFDHGHVDDFAVDDLDVANVSLSSGSVSIDHDHGGEAFSVTGSTDIDHDHAAYNNSINIPSHSQSTGAGSAHTHSGTYTPDHYHTAGSLHARIILSSSGYIINQYVALDAGHYWTATRQDTDTISVVSLPSQTYGTIVGGITNTANTSAVTIPTESSHTHSMTHDHAAFNASINVPNYDAANRSLVSGSTTVNLSNYDVANRSVSGSTDIDHGHGLSGAVTAYNHTTDAPVLGSSGDNGNPSPSAVATLPSYQQVVWVIRVY